MRPLSGSSTIARFSITVLIAAFSVWISGESACDLDRLAQVAHLQGERDPVGVADLNQDGLPLDGAEPRQLGLHVVGPRRDGRDHVQARFVGLDGADDVGRELVSVIVTPGTARPLASMTVPLISPDGV